MNVDVTRTTVLAALWYATVAALTVVSVTALVSLTDVAGQMRGVGILSSRFLGVPIDLGITAVWFATLVVLAGVVYVVVSWRPPGRLSGAE